MRAENSQTTIYLHQRVHIELRHLSHAHACKINEKQIEPFKDSDNHAMTPNSDNIRLHIDSNNTLETQ